MLLAMEFSLPLLALVLFVALGLAALHATFVPQSGLWGRNIWRGGHATPQREISLTFDDGPTPASTPQILDILRELEVRAAFFVIGSNARQWPELLRRIVAEGHLLENHSATHSHVGMFRGPWFWAREIEGASRVIEASTGCTPRYFRPPVGMKNFFTLRASRRGGLKMVTWSCRGLDGVHTTTQRIVERVTGRVKAGDIVALHDGMEPGSRRNPQVTVEALRPLILGLRQRGFKLVRLDEMLAAEGKG